MIKEIKFDDDIYPQSLRKIERPPLKLYAFGNINLLKEDGISIIGTRAITDYGKRYGRLICKDIALRDITIISGMALGSDTLAHKVALEYSGKTIAVLPCGLDNIFPKQNKGLFKKIIESGGLAITEYAPNAKADSEKFLERNRIVAGLGICLFVIEAFHRSGTSVTVRLAKSQGKDVFALPRKFG